MKIFATISQNVWNSKPTLVELKKAGVDMFRINMSHATLDDIKACHKQMKDLYPMEFPLCIDTEGAQMRTLNLAGGGSQHRYHKGDFARMGADNACYHFVPLPDNVKHQLKVGDTISVPCKFQVLEGNFLVALEDGEVEPNKPIGAEGDFDALPFTTKDECATNIGQKLNIKYYALSYASSAGAVWEFRKHLFHEDEVISKIETTKGLENLEEIVKASDAILIDRGDLSRHIDLKDIPAAQARIIRVTHEADKKVFVATNLLESMCNNLTPSIAEVNDVASLIKMGVDGLVLAAETAIGRHPVEVVKFIKEMIDKYEK